MTESVKPSPGLYQLTRAEALHPRYWLTWIGLALWRLTVLLPLPVLWLLGGALGELLHLLVASRRRVAMRNLENCFPHLDSSARSALVRQNFRRVGQSVFDTGLGAWASERRLHRLIEVEGYEHLEAAKADDTPVILLAPHFVSLGLCGLYWSQREPTFAMYKQTRNRLFHAAYRHVCCDESSGVAALDWLVDNRRRTSLGLVEHRAGLKPAVRRLRAQQHFYYLPDQDLGRRQAVFAPFFGVQASTISAASRFAQMAGARVVPCLLLQKPRGKGYRLLFRPALENYPGADLVADATAVNATIEALVREFPDQYFWLHKRFKTRPDGEPAFYR